MEVFCTDYVVLVLLQQAIFFPSGWLRSLFVLPPMDQVAKSGGRHDEFIYIRLVGSRKCAGYYTGAVALDYQSFVARKLGIQQIKVTTATEAQISGRT
jgi:hypothetical protein